MKNIPTGKDIWGDYNIDTWNKPDQYMFQFCIEGIAAILLLAEQSVIDRVTKQVSIIISNAKDGVIDSREAINQIYLNKLFSYEESVKMNESAKILGPVIKGSSGWLN